MFKKFLSLFKRKKKPPFGFPSWYNPQHTAITPEIKAEIRHLHRTTEWQPPKRRINGNE